MNMVLVILFGVFIIALILGLVCLSSFILMICWNAAIVPMFGMNEIEFGTAFAFWVFMCIIGGFFKKGTNNES